MSNEIELFGKKGDIALVDLTDFQELYEADKNLATSTSIPRISIRGSRFRQVIGGEETGVKTQTLNVVVVNSSPLGRTYYEGAYDPKAKAKPPVCWSHDTKTPSEDVPEDQRQAERCADCPQNIKGSGTGESRACRYSQRLAVALEGDYNKVYQLSIPATSIFGEAEGGDMPLNAYSKRLKGFKMPIAALVTHIYFDEDSETPKLFFKPERPLQRDELEKVKRLVNSEDAVQAITMTVSQVDGVEADDEEAEKPKGRTVKAASKPKAKPEPEPEVDEDEDETPPPPKRKAAKSKPEPEVVDDDIDDLLEEWDD